jgi:hypothetical protein
MKRRDLLAAAASHSSSPLGPCPIWQHGQQEALFV